MFLIFEYGDINYMIDFQSSTFDFEGADLLPKVNSCFKTQSKVDWQQRLNPTPQNLQSDCALT